LEGMLRIIPENEIVLLQLQRAYVGYAYGWVEDRADEYELMGRPDLAMRQRDRASYLYMRARDLGLHLLTLKAEGLHEARAAGLPAFERWLADEFTDEDDAGVLLWAGYAWGSYIRAAVEDLTVLEELPFVKVLVERSVALDRGYSNASGLAFLGAMLASPRYDDHAGAKRLFEEALAITERRSLGILLNMANVYAVATEDRALYLALLREVVEAGDVLPEGRLQNRIAKRRAARAIRRVDELFGPEGAPAAEAPEAAPASPEPLDALDEAAVEPAPRDDESN